jgi:exodeoxyribonuclease VII large subunit
MRDSTLFCFDSDADKGKDIKSPRPQKAMAEGGPPGARVFGVSELTRHVAELFRRDAVLRDVWVKGEVSNFHHQQSSGHMYFDLKDEQAVLRCIMFRDFNIRLRFKMEHGLKLLVRGEMMVYAARGEYELRVMEANLEGLGALYLAFEQLKKKLEAEGLFDPSLKRPLPRLPKVIGVVTSPTGAVLQDIRNILFGRFPNASILLAPTRVQGEGAQKEIVAAIELLNSIEHDPPEVIILARGGGSLEDLWPFNEEAVARAIRASRIAVVSAVGHETDFTISDFAADARAPTPSKAAEMVMPDKAETAASIERMAGILKRDLTNRFDQARQRTDDLSRGLGFAVASILTRRRETVMRMSAVLDAMSPLQVLGRGYSITIRQSTGTAVRDPGELAPGEDIRTLLARGDVVSTVTSSNSNKEGRPFPTQTRKRKKGQQTER